MVDLRTVVTVVVFAGTLVVLLPVGAPLSVSYVHSGSMTPTIEPYDGYFLVTGSTVGPGDVVTFWSDTHDEYVTHRIVGVTERGFVTKGDANRRTDQSTGHPYVARSAVVGEVVTVDGAVVTLPGFGVAVRTVRQYRVPLLALAVVATGLAAWTGDRRGRGRGRDRPITVGHLYVGLYLLAVGLVTAAFVSNASVHEWQFVVTTHGGPYGPPVGESAALNETFGRTAGPLAESFAHVGGLEDATTRRVAGGFRTTGTVPARAEPGIRTVRATVYRYPAFAPDGLVRLVGHERPVLAVLAAAAITLAPPFAAVAAATDPHRPLRLPRTLRGGR